MEILPKLKVTRFAQLNSGDLFIYSHNSGQCIALVVSDTTCNNQKLVLPLGPTFPDKLTWPTLLNCEGVTVISFGKEYQLQLPSQAEGWVTEEPSFDKNCILVTEKGSYFRADCSTSGRSYKACYVDIATGAIHTAGAGVREEFTKPAGIPAYALTWEILTTEKEPRKILTHPCL